MPAPSRPRRAIRIGLLGVGLSLIAIQFVPVRRESGLGAGDPETSREVKWVLRRACYDCHSLETRWPIWGYVAPISWQVVRDVNRARAALNFSDWAAYPYDVRVARRASVAPITAAHRMPLWYYVTLHPDSKLSSQDQALLQEWSRTAIQEPVRPR